MKTTQLPPPTRRPLKIFAFDPMLGRTAGNRGRIEVANEPLQPGPVGARLEVIDYDGAHECFYEPVDLDEPAILMQRRPRPSESDPRFHQQMVYAVAMRTLENFDRALGPARCRFARRASRAAALPACVPRRERLLRPDELFALLFGYFRADADDPGPNLPGQTVFTCLSHDIIAHEMTHAIVDRLRPHFSSRPTATCSPSTKASPTSSRSSSTSPSRTCCATQIQQHARRPPHRRRSLVAAGAAVRLRHRRRARRCARRSTKPGRRRCTRRSIEPHDRGSILVAAVFDALLRDLPAPHPRPGPHRHRRHRRRCRRATCIPTSSTASPREAVADGAAACSTCASAPSTTCRRWTSRSATTCARWSPPTTSSFPTTSSACARRMIEAFRLRGILPEASVARRGVAAAGASKNSERRIADLAAIVRAQSSSRSVARELGRTTAPQKRHAETKRPRAATRWTRRRNGSRSSTSSRGRAPSPRTRRFPPTRSRTPFGAISAAGLARGSRPTAVISAGSAFPRP